jgi:phosphonate transport system permease protein
VFDGPPDGLDRIRADLDLRRGGLGGDAPGAEDDAAEEDEADTLQARRCGWRRMSDRRPGAAHLAPAAAVHRQRGCAGRSMAAFAIYLVLAISTVDVNWTRIAEGWSAACASSRASSSPTSPRAARHPAGHDREPDDDGDLDGGRRRSSRCRSASAPPATSRRCRSTTVCRAIIAVSRAFQEIIVAILFVAMFGFGPFAGFLTLLRHDRLSVQAARRGHRGHRRGPGRSDPRDRRGWWQVINYAIQPQVMPRLIGLSLYRLDINFRESAVIGIVGAGGIGATLNTAMDRYEYDTRRRHPDHHHPDRDARGIRLQLLRKVPAVMPNAASPTNGAGGRRASSLAMLDGWFGLVALTVFCWQVMNENTIWAFVADAPRQAADIGRA